MHFRLPDDRAVLQRRTKDAPYAPGLLGEFGGWIEEGESPDEAIRRELQEETSLDVDQLDIRLVREFVIPAGKSFSQARKFYLYEAEIDDLEFEVYEGEGAEAFTVAQLETREDLTASAMYTFQPSRTMGSGARSPQIIR
jgi:8-oxo-dGTP pyrophosphatase MutT (NUDIX family)